MLETTALAVMELGVVPPVGDEAGPWAAAAAAGTLVVVVTALCKTPPTDVATVAIAVGAAGGVRAPPCCGSQLDTIVPPSSLSTTGRPSR